MGAATRSSIIKRFLTSKDTPRPIKSSTFELIENGRCQKTLFHRDIQLAIRSHDANVDGYICVWLRLRDHTPDRVQESRAEISSALRDEGFESTGITSVIGESIYEEWTTREGI